MPEKVQLIFKRKIRTWSGIQISDLQIPSLALYHEVSLFNRRYRSKFISWRQCYARRCGLWHCLSSLDRRTNFVFIYSGVLNQIDKWLVKFKFKFKTRILVWIRIQISDLQISSLALYHLSYPGSIDDTGLNFSLESNAMQGAFVCDTVCPRLTGELRVYFFFLMF